MKKFFKEYLGFIAAVGLAGGSLFAFNISTSIDNALQVIKTIWVTSDGTTTNPPFMTMDGSGKYVSIGTTASGETVSISGSIFAKDNETILFAGNDAGDALGYPIPGVMLGIDATASSGATASIIAYDTRAVDSNGKLGINITSNANLGVNGAESEASLNTNEGDNMDLNVEQGFDLSNYDQNNHIGTVTSTYRSEISMDPDHIQILTHSGITRTATGDNDFDINYNKGSHIEVDPLYVRISGSSGSHMYFDSSLGLFGFGTNNPGNTIDIGGSYINGTLGLRFSNRQNASGQILGINNSGDVITLGNINSFGGGGNPGPWQYGAGSPQSAQIMGAGNTSNGSRAVVGGLNNIGDGYASFVGGGLYNEAMNSGNVAVGGAYNRSHGLLLSTIVGGTYNTINSGGNASFIGGGSDNTINARNSAILVGSQNLINGTSNTIGGGEYNAIDATLSIIGAGSGNSINGSRSAILGGIQNIVGGLYGTIVAGANNIVNGNYGFIGGGFSNVLSVGALYSLVAGGENNSVTDRYSSIVGGLNNINQSEKSFIGGGEGNNIDLNSGISAIVAGSGNTINSGSVNSFIGGGFDNIIQDSVIFGANTIGGGGSNMITNGIAASIVGGYGNSALGGGGMFIGGGSENHADGDGMTVVGGAKNWAGSISGSAAHGFIGGGSENTTIDSSKTVIVGGEQNRIEEKSDYSSILGGYKNIITSSRLARIGGGSGNAITASGDYTTIGGGFNNIVDNAPASFIGGGHDNYIASGGPVTIDYPNTIAGGSHNSAIGILNTIAGGVNNMADGTLFTIGGGNNNRITADGDGSTIAGGTSNTITGAGNKNFIGGGQFNTIEYGSNSSIGGGGFNTLSGGGSVIPGGDNNIINGNNSFAAGQNASALTDDTFVWNGSFTPFSSTIANTFLVNAPNGVGINTNDTNNKALRVNGSVQANDYYSANNNQGMTTTLTNIGGGGCNMTFENGLLVSTSGC